jgi:hypothetical protein
MTFRATARDVAIGAGRVDGEERLDNVRTDEEFLQLGSNGRSDEAEQPSQPRRFLGAWAGEPGHVSG